MSRFTNLPNIQHDYEAKNLCKRISSNIIDRYNSVINDSLIDFINIVEKNFEKVIDIVNKMNFADKDNLDNMDYSEETNDFYICRYGLAYAYEYAVITDLLIRAIYSENRHPRLNIVDFGAGSMNAAWAIAYNIAGISCGNPNYLRQFAITYKGVDMNRWKRKFVNADNEPNAVLGDVEKCFNEIKFYKSDLNDYLKTNYLTDGRGFTDNVILFSKILNNLSGNDLDELIENFEEMDFPNDEYFVCASHALSKVCDGTKAIQRIVDVMTAKGFEATANYKEIIGENQVPHFNGRFFMHRESNGNNTIIDRLTDVSRNKAFYEIVINNMRKDERPENIEDCYSNLECYTCESLLRTGNENRITDMRFDLKLQRAVQNRSFYNLVDLSIYLRNLQNRVAAHPKCRENPRTWQVVRVSQIVFQIIRLKRI